MQIILISEFFLLKAGRLRAAIALLSALAGLSFLVSIY
jgi:hypothetical protein